MLDLAPPTSLAGPPPAVDHDASGLGRAFVDAIVAGDFDRLEALFTPDVRFRAIIPDEYQEASTAAGARALIEDWFGGTDPRVLLGSKVGLVGDRLTVGYRLELTDDGERRIVEQHVAAAVDGASLRDLALVCSGFRPLATPGAASRMLGGEGSPDDAHVVAPASTPAARLDATGLSCATLTPTIAATVRGLDFGAVLEIVTDDPDAEEGLRSWTRLTGNELVAAEAGPGSTRRFGIRRSPRDAAASTRKGAN
jgi:TusA-related sulfurtransferase